jgi:hypothetical protein
MSAELPNLPSSLRFLAALPGVGTQHPLYEIKSVNEMYRQGEISATWADLMVRRILWNAGYARRHDGCRMLHLELRQNIEDSGMWDHPYLDGYDRGHDVCFGVLRTPFNRSGTLYADPAAVRAFASMLNEGWGDAPPQRIYVPGF